MSVNKYEQIVETCCSLLHESPLASRARQYIDERFNRSIQDKFRIGYFPDQANLSILTGCIDQKTLDRTELLYEDRYQTDTGSRILVSPMQDHNLIIPYLDVYGSIIALVGRSLLSDEQRAETRISKYKNTAFKKSQHLFGLNLTKYDIIKHGFVYLVEGQFDAIRAHASGITNTVALGTSNMSMEQLILILRYTNNIKILLDNDEAGVSGRNRIVEKFGKYANISNVYIPDGYKDLDELLVDIQIDGIGEFNTILEERK